MTVAPCESFGRWHRWQTLEVVADLREARSGHAIRMMRCERCGTLSWRWAPVPDGAGVVPEDAGTARRIGTAGSADPA